ncbi:MAG: hypothetical protein WDW38_008569 [Sanguina aurantia]
MTRSRAQPTTRCRSSQSEGEETSEPKSPAEPSSSSGASSDDVVSEQASTEKPLILPAMGADSDWRAFRAKLVASNRTPDVPGEGDSMLLPASTSSSSWAHSIPLPEKGAVLMAHPLQFTDSQSYFYQAVILLLDHSENGSHGIILNRPTKFKMGDVLQPGMLEEFAKCQLNLGGDVGSGSETTVLHPYDLTGSQQVMDGLFQGGISACSVAVQSGEADPEKFRWFTRYAGWGPGQLAQECRRGVWFVAATASSVVLAEPTGGDGTDLWHTILGLMGGDYAQLSSALLESASIKSQITNITTQTSEGDDAPQ